MGANREKSSFLFVYGSLIEPGLRKRLLGREVHAVQARLDGYEKRRGRYFFVVPREGAVTDGLLLSGLSAQDLEILDQYEEVPRLYTRERVSVVSAKARQECWVYLPVGAL